MYCICRGNFAIADEENENTWEKSLATFKRPARDRRAVVFLTNDPKIIDDVKTDEQKKLSERSLCAEYETEDRSTVFFFFS